ncbi:TonB-dependent receptor [Aliikangiella marina]|uniref:TonB-dependent receptor n=2 Tax=Aliikangiella marina TaxID=1712262 RepID=A0A545TEI7_9GAMM|nr:TonB-dependent receptor [Aliikangiella marina]
MSALSVGLSVAVNLSAQESQTPNTDDDKGDYENRLLIVGQNNTLNTEAGSATIIDEVQLEKYEFDDIHRILAQVPGVNIRQEDGYGLRPNIGFRGVTPERSKKINILEDGILIGPAPYSAPAAYYFPMVSRMTSVEVYKGPSAILYGPNTVAGTLNMLTRQVSQDNEGMVDVSYGSDAYSKFHGYAIHNFDNLGVLIEGINLQSDGFKTLDSGGDTGFDKKDITTKFRYDLKGEQFDQVFELKLGYADELSNETYLGLTDEDFALSPFRRYAASQLGEMDWQHEQVQFNHFLQGENFDITTRAYRNDFERAWRKLNNFRPSNNPATQRSLQDILSAPSEGINAIYYQVLTGQKDSEGLFEQLLIGVNDRTFYSQGVQTDLNLKFEWGDITHNIKTGIRYHEDEIERFHTEDNFNMVSGILVATGAETAITTANTERSKVWSIYLKDTLELDQWELTFGFRSEIIDSYYQNNLVGFENDWLKKSTTIVLPGVSAFYSIDDMSGVFAGLHRGFIPTSPKQSPEIEIEDSTNLELGYRYFNQANRIELVGFYSDFDNLKESCTASTSSSCFSIIDQEFNAGNAEVFGLEASWADRFSLSNDIDVPWMLTYSYTSAEFQETFDSDFELWGDVSAGDSVPYLPEHQLTLDIGLEASQWRTNLMISYVDEMNEAAGDNVALSGVMTDAYWNLDLSAAYDFMDYGTVYLKAENVLDEVNIISRRPFGARPSKPQQFYLGYKYRW